MKLTNKLGLPQPIVDAVAADSYTKGAANISVTGLLSPPRQRVLKSLHWNDIEEDASERIWSLLGQVVHGILERAEKTAIAERRLSINVNGWVVSGAQDRFDNSSLLEGGLLQDYKFVTAYKFKNNEVPLEFVQQLNCYVEILRQNNEIVTKAEIVAILRDWSKLEAKRDPSYPQTGVLRLDVPIWEREKTQAFLLERVKLHQEAENNLPLCSVEDKWEKPTTWAVLKQGQERAVKVYDNEDHAKSHVAAQKEGANLYIQKRPGIAVRCQSYCSAAPFCEQYQNTLPKTGKTDLFFKSVVGNNA